MYIVYLQYSCLRASRVCVCVFDAGVVVASLRPFCVCIVSISACVSLVCVCVFVYFSSPSQFLYSSRVRRGTWADELESNFVRLASPSPSDDDCPSSLDVAPVVSSLDEELDVVSSELVLWWWLWADRDEPEGSLTRCFVVAAPTKRSTGVSPDVLLFLLMLMGGGDDGVATMDFVICRFLLPSPVSAAT